MTSPVYDYFLGLDPNEIALKHFCLPIWYSQDDDITNKVLVELNNV